MMAIKYITADHVARLRETEHADFATCIEAVASAYQEVGEGTARLLSRQSLVESPDPGVLRPRSVKIMGASLLQAGFMGVITYPAGYGRPIDWRIVLSSAETGQALAIIEGEVVTHLATACVTAVATRELAPQGAKILGLIGTGTYAFDQPVAIAKVRPIEEVRCYSRNRENRADFAARLGARLDGIRVVPVDSAAEAVAGADILTTITSASDPVISSTMIEDGLHVNAIGMHYPKTREIDSETMRRALFFVDDREQTFIEKGEFLIPKDEGLIDQGHIVADLGELVAGKTKWRRAETDLTVFGSGGTAIEYLGTAICLYKVALEMRLGSEL